jgi:hypothetical protein
VDDTLILVAMSLLKQIVSFHVHLIFHQTVKLWGQENIGPFSGLLRKFL